MLKWAHIPHILAFHLQIEADPYPAYHFDADAALAYLFDADPDPTFQFAVDPDPQHWSFQYYQMHSI